jgi:hypothetical protein
LPGNAKPPKWAWQDSFSGRFGVIPVSDLNAAAAYYASKLGFNLDWGSEDGGMPASLRGSAEFS